MAGRAALLPRIREITTRGLYAKHSARRLTHRSRAPSRRVHHAPAIPARSVLSAENPDNCSVQRRTGVRLSRTRQWQAACPPPAQLSAPSTASAQSRGFGTSASNALNQLEPRHINTLRCPTQCHIKIAGRSIGSRHPCRRSPNHSNRYHRVDILRGIDFDVSMASSFAIVGPSAAAKALARVAGGPRTPRPAKSFWMAWTSPDSVRMPWRSYRAQSRFRLPVVPSVAYFDG